VCSVAVPSKLHAGTARLGCPSVGGQRTAVPWARGSCLRSHRSSVRWWRPARCRCYTAKFHRACFPSCCRRVRSREQAGQCKVHGQIRSSEYRLEAHAGLLAGEAAKSKQPVRVRHHRHLTLRSSGQPPAGFAHRRLPLTSNVSPLPGIPMRRVTSVRTTNRAASHQWLSCAARIAHGGAVPDRMAAETQLASSARAVRPLAAGAPPALLARGSGVFSTAVLSNRRCQMQPEGEHTNPNQMPWLTHRASTLALRMSAEPELLGSAGTGFARAAGIGALGWQGTSQGRGAPRFVPSFARANTSVERTTTGKPAVAAHLQR